MYGKLMPAAGRQSRRPTHWLGAQVETEARCGGGQGADVGRRGIRCQERDRAGAARDGEDVCVIMRAVLHCPSLANPTFIVILERSEGSHLSRDEVLRRAPDDSLLPPPMREWQIANEKTPNSSTSVATPAALSQPSTSLHRAPPWSIPLRINAKRNASWTTMK